MGRFENLREIIRVNQPDEIIFSAADIGAGQIIEAINMLSSARIERRLPRQPPGQSSEANHLLKGVKSLRLKFPAQRKRGKIGPTGSLFNLQ
ncbi:MAG: hypothetical protein R2727_01690 [Bacteroidales bacterium]